MKNQENFPLIPFATYYNKGSNEWESFKLTDVDLLNKIVSFETFHFSIFSAASIILASETIEMIKNDDNILIMKELYNNLKEDVTCSYLQQSLVNANKISDDSYALMEDFAEAYDFCNGSLVCGGKDIEDWVTEEIFKTVHAMEIEAILLMLGHSTAAGGVLALAATPCVLCITITSTINPAFWVAYFSYAASNASIRILEDKINKSSCEKSGLKFEDFGITNEVYPDITDRDKIISETFGDEYRVADWNDLVKFHNTVDDITVLMDGLGLTEWGSSACVNWNGDSNWSYNTDRYFFCTRHKYNKSSNYLAHQNIDNYSVSLGSWWFTGRKIIAVKKTF